MVDVGTGVMGENFLGFAVAVGGEGIVRRGAIRVGASAAGLGMSGAAAACRPQAVSSMDMTRGRTQMCFIPSKYIHRNLSRAEILC